MPLSKWDRRFLELAETVSKWSKDPSTKVGAVIVDTDKRVVSLGFNGFPQQFKDIEAEYNDRETKYGQIVHGEINAILFARRSLEGCTLYTWPSISCDKCSPIVVQSGIKRVVCPRPTSDMVSRWGDKFAISRNNFRKGHVELLEVESWLVES